MLTDSPNSVQTLAYGSSGDQAGDLHLPAATAREAPLICLIHGGFWRMPWGRDHIVPLAADLARRGFAVWNLEYRRVGQTGGGWPGTLQDVCDGIDYLATLAADLTFLDTRRVTVIGHSAGGQLALWAAKTHAAARVRVTRAVGLAPVADLVLAQALRCGGAAVDDFLGGTPQMQGLRYAAASPAALLPLGVRQLIVHGTQDEDVPVDVSRRYVAAARAAGDDIEFIEMESASHMDLINPASDAHVQVCRWLAASYLESPTA